MPHGPKRWVSRCFPRRLGERCKNPHRFGIDSLGFPGSGKALAGSASRQNRRQQKDLPHEVRPLRGPGQQKVSHGNAGLPTRLCSSFRTFRKSSASWTSPTGDPFSWLQSASVWFRIHPRGTALQFSQGPLVEHQERSLPPLVCLNCLYCPRSSGKPRPTIQSCSSM